jgi:type I restriction enzyme S subunit
METPFWTIDTLFYTTISDRAIPRFIFYVFCSINWQQYNAATGVPSLAASTIESIKIPLPPLAEQRKIAEILRTWDEAIETAEAELKAKQERKRWLMDRLFKFSPESHLEQVKMQDAVDVRKGEQLNRHTLAEKGSYPVWNGGITPSGYTESFNTEGPAVIMSEGGNSCGAITRVNENFWRGGHCYHVVPRNGFSNDYLFAALKYYEPQIMRLRVGSGLPNIQKKTFLSWGTPLHKPAYRDKVASVFSHAQLEGELANKYIETLRTQKRGLMQKLLTGEVRVAT